MTASSPTFSFAPNTTVNPIFAPLTTPFYFPASGSATSSSNGCGASILAPINRTNTATYCCAGLLIDISQPLRNSSQNPYFQNLRCCSGDSEIALGTVTKCTSGGESALAAQTTFLSETTNAAGSVSTVTVTRSTMVTDTTVLATATSGGEGLRLDWKIGILAFIVAMLGTLGVS